jgi:plastocyanin
MNRLWILLLILFVALSGCTGKDSEQANVTVSATSTPVQTTAKPFPVLEPLTVYVTIMGTMFNPSELNITNGTTVKWTNQDSGQYIVNVSGSRSSPLYKRDNWSYTFNKTGIYESGCDLHPSMPHGRITVI